MNEEKQEYIRNWLFRANEDIAIKIKETVEGLIKIANN
jgi:hypothetical protein